MTDAAAYFTAVKTFFAFLITEFDYSQNKEIKNGSAFYEIEYRNGHFAISISYENSTGYFQVIVYKLTNRQGPNYGSPESVFHLNELNKKIMPLISNHQISESHKLFALFKESNVLEKQILKAAKEIRLALKFYPALIK